MAPKCPSANTQAIDQSSFWDAGNLNWDEHRIGWAIGGGCAALTVLISLVSIWKHCRNYNKPNEQRQVLRILYLPPVYAVVSFFSYRFFRSYTYYSLAEAAYEAVTLSAFLLLLIEYVAETASGHSALKAMERKDKRPLPIPFCCWRYRPTKAYFMYTVKWTVLQYVIIRPACSVAGIICEAFNILCSSGPYSVYFANVYLEVIDFISISIALYGLLLFYGLTKDELHGRRPLAKFLSIKLIVMFTFYQSFVFDTLAGRVIKSTQYWTATNIADGLNALAICVEMVFFSLLMMWAYTWNEYKVEGAPKTSIWRPLWDSINFTDFIVEIVGSLKFFLGHSGGRSDAAIVNNYKSMDFGQAFGVDGKYPADMVSTNDNPSAIRPRASYDEEIRLAPYPYSNAHNAGSRSPMVL
ncbi:organic solute transporter Ostalpha-domain-containing protein [Boletus edulis]|uniref:Organic solute transporter Ostalpha-domain-containing protein n=1 Tax=Boletus edulis BED1 TaxID=1328754 RepID=A0AAD4G8X8_BOLED|nr:organic solute transporter Ostalpha-domain-containing protein [Boletus edulis]KAF8129775.1 organic solute transporter Ostalpha-domain-containing protein [Boletus edulis]KAF8429936.1 organic solute transporter Ostalpha-domain-containing protein [Boletus edulis BED1]